MSKKEKRPQAGGPWSVYDATFAANYTKLRGAEQAAAAIAEVAP